MKKRFTRLLGLCALGLMLGAAIAWQQIGNEARTLNELNPAAGHQDHHGHHAASAKKENGKRAVAAAEPAIQIGGPFLLTDHHGNKVTQKDFPGLKLAFFGFTHCPDICPAGLQKMSLTLKALGDEAAKIQPLFFTVDPERDTPEIMKDYVGLYDERLTGLTGTPAEIKVAIESFRVYAAKVEGADEENYTLNHSGYTYLLDDDGVMLTVFGADETPSQIAAEIRKFM